LVTHPGYHKGEPTDYIGTYEERKAMPNGFAQLGRDFAMVGSEAYKFGRRVLRKMRKNMGKSRRRKVYLANLEQYVKTD